MRWEAVWQGDSETAAEIVAGRLVVDGICARTMGARPTVDTPTHQFARDTWAVFVPASAAAHARALLRASGETAGVVAGDRPGIDWTLHRAGFLVAAATGLAIATLVALVSLLR